MIQDQLREAYSANLIKYRQHHPYGSTTVIESLVESPDELILEEPECDTFPLHVEVEMVDYTLSFTKSTDDRIVYERDR